MSFVRAGTIPDWKYVTYALIVLAETAAVTMSTTDPANPGHIVTGIVLGVTLGVPMAWLLRRADSVLLAETVIVRSSFLRRRQVSWDHVIGGRFAYDEHRRWVLALDVTEGGDRHNELVLMSIAPVRRPPASPYDMHRRQQIIDILMLLHAKRIPVTLLPEIAINLNEYWRIAVHRDNDRTADRLDEEWP